MNSELELAAPLRFEGLRLWWQSLQAERLAAQTRHELHALSDHLLRDIGLERDQIDTLLR